MNESFEELPDVPTSWIKVKISDVGRVVSGGTPTTNNEEYFTGDVPWITPADLTNYKSKFISRGRRNISEDGLKNSSAKLVPSGSILFSSRAPIGYVVIAANKIATNQGFKNLIPSPYLFNEYIYYYLLSSKQLAESFASGTTFKEISGTSFGKLPIPLPPFPEQHRIVAKLEELFTKLDVAVDELKKAKVQIKRYRQSVLKYAFEGKLTEELQIKNKNNITETSDELLAKIKEERKKALGKKYRELPQVDTTNLPQLPKGWNWCNLEFLTTILGDGLHGTPKYTEEGEYFFINGNNLVDGKIEIKTDTKRIAREEFDKYKKSLNENSVLVSINGTLGRTAFYNNERVILGKSACYFNLFEAIEKKYIRFILISQRFIDYANKTATGSTIKNVPLSAMRGFEIPIPQFPEEQQQIVSEIERHFSVADATENIINQSLKQAERLRQSILKDAFRGKLVPQDPNDEPAEKLLERIKELKEKENMIIKKAKQKK